MSTYLRLGSGECQHRHTPDGNSHYYSEEFKRIAVNMCSEGASISADARAMGVSLTAVYTWVKKARWATQTMNAERYQAHSTENPI